jgi:ribonuclease E
VIRALRDHYRTDIGEILIDSEKAFKQAQDFMTMVMPGSLSKLKLFEDKLPLFNRFQIENQIESAFSREVSLPSGGAIVIDHTEALTSIDVNSARATRGSDIEETAKNTNLEAAEEVARQLRIRDLGGLIVIDFIDMMQNKNQRDVETRLRNSVYDDRARVQIGRISRFGLLEMSRQRLRPSLEESSQIVCPRCSGQGTIRDVESLSLAVMRLLEEESMKDNTGKILAKMPVECATYLLNEKRDKIDDIEQRRGVHIVVIPDPRLETPHYLIERVKDNDTHRHESNYKKSYELTTDEEPVDYLEMASSTTPTVEIAAVQRIAPPTPRPSSTPTVEEKPVAASPGLFSKIIGLFTGGDDKPVEEAAKPEVETSSANRQNQNRSGNRSRRGNRRGGQGRQRNNNQSNNTQSNSEQSNSDQNKGDQNKSAEAAPDKEAATEKTEAAETKRNSSSRSGRSRGGRGGNRNRQRQGQNVSESKPAQTEQTEQASADGDTGNNDTSGNANAKPRRERRPRQDKQPSQQAKSEVDGNTRPEAGPEPDGNSRPETKPSPERNSRPDSNPQADGNSRSDAGAHDGNKAPQESKAPQDSKPPQESKAPQDSKPQQESKAPQESKPAQADTNSEPRAQTRAADNGAGNAGNATAGANAEQKPQADTSSSKPRTNAAVSAGETVANATTNNSADKGKTETPKALAPAPAANADSGTAKSDI